MTTTGTGTGTGTAGATGTATAGGAAGGTLPGLRPPFPPDFLPPTPTRRFDVRSADGTRIAVQVHDRRPAADDGSGAPTVLLVHGWACSASFWSRVVHRLLPHARVVVLDQRGHGRSGPVPDGGFTPDAIADDVAAVLAAVAPPDGRVVVAGHSMGAMALVAFAGRHPQACRRQVGAALLASTGMEQLTRRSALLPHPAWRGATAADDVARQPGPLRLALARRALGDNRPLHRMPLRMARATLVRTVMSRTATADERAFCTDIVLACPRRTYEGFALMLDALDLSADLPRLDVPASVLVGTEDRLTPVWHARRMVAALPRPLGLVEVPGAGHMTPLTAPDEVTAAILALLA